MNGGSDALILMPFHMMSSRVSFHTVLHLQSFSEGLFDTRGLIDPRGDGDASRRASSSAAPYGRAKERARSPRGATSASVRSRLVSNAEEDQGETQCEEGRPVPSSSDWCQCVVCSEEGAVLRVRRLAYTRTVPAAPAVVSVVCASSPLLR